MTLDTDDTPNNCQKLLKLAAECASRDSAKQE